MNRLTIPSTLTLVALIVGTSFLGCRQGRTGSALPNPVNGQSSPPRFSTDMLKVIRQPKEPVRIVSVRLANVSMPTSDFLIDVENVSAKRITDVWYFLGPYEGCANAPQTGRPVISNMYPGTLASSPREFIRPHETLTLKIPVKLYEQLVEGQRKWNCPFTTELRLRGVGYVGEPLVDH